MLVSFTFDKNNRQSLPKSSRYIKSVPAKRLIVAVESSPIKAIIYNAS